MSTDGQVECYNAALQWALDNIDRSDNQRAELVTFLITCIVVETADFYLAADDLSPQLFKNHLHLLLKFCIKFPEQMDGMWRSTIFCYTESFAPLLSHEPFVAAAVFNDGDDDIFTITKEYLVSLDEARRDKDAAGTLMSQICNYSLFYRELSITQFAPTAPAAILNLLITTHEIQLGFMAEFFNGQEDGKAKRFLFPHDEVDSAVPVEYFFRHENSFSIYPDGQIGCIPSYIKHTKVTDEIKAKVTTGWTPTPEHQLRCFKSALVSTSYLKYLSSPLNERQLGYMVREFRSFKDLDEFAIEVKKLAEGKEHPLWEPLLKLLD